METLTLLQTNMRFSLSSQKVMRFVTASDSSHFQSSLQLLSSIFEHERNPAITYVDLGLSLTEKSQIRVEFPTVEIEVFPFASYPVWFDMADNAGQFAWKANSIQLSHRDFSGIVVWMDAGCKLTRSMSLVNKITVTNGLFILPANCSIQALTHPNSIKALKFEDSVNLPMFSAAFIAFDIENPITNKILESWVSSSNIKAIIAPSDSSPLNHRYDQSLISMLIHKNEQPNYRSYRKLRSKHFGFLIHQDVEFPANPRKF